MRRSYFAPMIVVLMLASLITGIGHVALLPPFEGFDETGHYAYIQQIATTGRWPAHGDPMSKDIGDYLKVAPTTENMHAPLTYHGFFSANAETVERGRQFIQDRPPSPRGFTAASDGSNWQAQHPPLYYFAMAPAYRLSQGWSLAAQLFFLRSLSYLIAWGGLCIVTIAMLRNSLQPSPLATLLPLGIAVWPAIFPMWFPEMGRLGNDSLVTVFAAFTLLAVYRLSAEDSIRSHAILGATLGLALLTKATFLPVAAAAFVLLAIRVVMARRAPDQLSGRIKGFVVCAVIVASVCGWWYLTKFAETGSIIGSNDDVIAKTGGGIIAGLKKNVDLIAALRAPWGLVASFLWAGTWSFILPPRVTLIPILALAALIAFGAFRQFQRRPIHPVAAFALLSLLIFIIALIQHSFVLMAIAGNPAPAWYLHSIAPILALLVGYGIAGAANGALLCKLVGAAFIYAPFFLVGSTMLNVLFFAGCAPVIPGRRYFSWAEGANCLADLPRMYANLSVVAFPGVGVALFAIGWCLLLAGMVMAAQHLPHLNSTREPTRG